MAYTHYSLSKFILDQVIISNDDYVNGIQVIQVIQFYEIYLPKKLIKFE